MIRPIRPSDAAAIWTLFERSLGYDCTFDTVQSCIEALADNPHYHIRVWEDDETGDVCAFIQAQRYDTLHNAGGWNVISLAVLPQRQKEGIGRALLADLETRVLHDGGAFVRLNSRIERAEAHAFYEHLGYACDKTQKRFIKRLA